MGQKKSARPAPVLPKLRLRQWRLQAGLNQEQLAAKVGITTASVSRLENGKQPYSQGLLQDLAQALGCKPWQLLPDAPEMTARQLKLLEVFSQLDEQGQSFLEAFLDRELLRR